MRRNNLRIHKGNHCLYCPWKNEALLRLDLENKIGSALKGLDQIEEEVC